MAKATIHRHGAHLHAHRYSGPHRHLWHPRRSRSLQASRAQRQGHNHGLIDPTITRSRAGIQAVALSLLVLGLAAAAQTVIFALTSSVALLADLIHNFGDAATAFPPRRGVRSAKRAGRALG